MNFPTLLFYTNKLNPAYDLLKEMLREILQSVHHLEKLFLGDCCIKFGFSSLFWNLFTSFACAYSLRTCLPLVYYLFIIILSTYFIRFTSTTTYIPLISIHLQFKLMIDRRYFTWSPTSSWVARGSIKLGFPRWRKLWIHIQELNFFS